MHTTMRVAAALCAAGTILWLGGCARRTAVKHTAAKDTAAVHTAAAADSAHPAADTAQQAADTAAQAADTTVHTAVDSLYYTPPLNYEQSVGRHLYMHYCDVCHGDQGKGDGFNSYNLNPKPADLSDAHYMNNFSDAQLLAIISGGGRSVNKSPMMPSWGGVLSKDELQYVLAFVRTFALADTTAAKQ